MTASGNGPGEDPQLRLPFLFDAEGRARGKRGKMLRLLNLTAAHADVSKPMADVLRAVDDRAREWSSADLTYSDIARWVGWNSDRSARRWCKAAANGGLLDFESVGSRYIADPSRRQRENRDTETLYRFRIQWSLLNELFGPNDSPASDGNSGLIDGNIGQPAGQSGQPTGQSFRPTSFTALKPPPSPPDDWREVEDFFCSMKKKPGAWRNGVRTARDNRVTPAEVMHLAEKFDSECESRGYGEGVLNNWLINAFPGQTDSDLYQPKPTADAKSKRNAGVQQRRDKYVPRLQKLTLDELESLANYCLDELGDPKPASFIARIRQGKWASHKQGIHPACVESLITAYVDLHESDSAEVSQ